MLDLGQGVISKYLIVSQKTAIFISKNTKKYYFKTKFKPLSAILKLRSTPQSVLYGQLELVSCVDIFVAKNTGT